MKLKDVLEPCSGEYSRIGATSGWLWIGYISDKTLPELDEILAKWRKRRFEMLAEVRRRKTKGKKTIQLLEKLEAELKEPWVPAAEREVIDCCVSDVDAGNLIRIVGHEIGDAFGFLPPEKGAVIPYEMYKKLAGEIVKVAGEDLRAAVSVIVRDDLTYFSNMTAGQSESRLRQLSKKRLEADRLKHESMAFFESDLFDMFCNDLEADEIERMARRSVRRDIMKEFKAKAELYEKRLHKDRQRTI